MSPVLVTGGSGYVGTQLIAALLGTGPRYGPRSGRSTARPGCARQCAVAALTTLAWRSWSRT